MTEGFFELFGLPMTLGGFTHENFVPPSPAAPDGAAADGRRASRIASGRICINGDPAIVGKPIRFAEFATTIAGVAPRDFDTPHGGDFWFSHPARSEGDVNHGFDGFMRLKPGATIERARSEMAPVMAGLARDFPASAT